jgi:hypothetical protein
MELSGLELGDGRMRKNDVACTRSGNDAVPKSDADSGAFGLATGIANEARENDISADSTLNALAEWDAEEQRYADYLQRAHINAMLFAIMAGIIGSFTVLLGKCFSEVVQSAYLPGDLPRFRTQARHDVVAWQLWIFAFGAAFAGVTQVALVNRAIELHDAMNILPFFQFTWILFSAIGGIIFYHQHLHTMDWLACGAAVALCAVAILLFARRSRGVKFAEVDLDPTAVIRCTSMAPDVFGMIPERGMLRLRATGSLGPRLAVGMCAERVQENRCLLSERMAESAEEASRADIFNASCKDRAATLKRDIKIYGTATSVGDTTSNALLTLSRNGP